MRWTARLRRRPDGALDVGSSLPPAAASPGPGMRVSGAGLGSNRALRRRRHPVPGEEPHVSELTTPGRSSELAPPDRLERRLDRDRRARRGHRPGAGRGRRAEGRQRPPRDGDEPGPGGVPAVPERDAARPGRRPVARPGPLRAVLRALQPDPLHPAVPVRLRPAAVRPGVAAHLGLADPRAPRAPAHPRRRDHHRPARARAWPARSAWRWPPAASAACSTRTPPPARARSTTTSTCSARTATSWRASPPRPARWPATSSSATSW